MGKLVVLKTRVEEAKAVFSQCLKIPEKVSFYIESYLYIWSGQKFMENTKNGPFWRGFENLKLAVKQRHQRGLLKKGEKLVEIAKMRHFE